MKKKFSFREIEPIQVLALGCLVFSLISSFCSILFQNETFDVTIVPFHQIVIPVTHIISTVVSLFIFLFPRKQMILYIVILFQTILLSLTGLEIIGVFLFSLIIFQIYLNSNLHLKRQKIIIILMYLLFTIVLSGSIVYGKERFFIALGHTYFFASAIYCIILINKQKLKHSMPLIQQELYIGQNIKLPSPGEILYLSDYNLTERQKSILFESITKNKSYGEIAMKYNLSLSLVKKEMTNILQYFGCKNINSLKIVFNQFEIKLA